MNLSWQWLKSSFLLWAVSRRPDRVAAAQRFIDSTNERYIDADLWAGMRGISIQEASAQLETGVQMHLLDKCALYEWNDSPVRFVVPASQIGRTVRLADIGYIGDDDEREIFISENRVRTVFISAGSDKS
jgi:hypothetical protein